MTFARPPFRMTRRRALASLAAAPLALHGVARAQDSQAVRICQSIALSGPLGDLGQAMHQGAQACFAAVNAQGGVHGRKIALLVQDDGYDVKRALANAEAFLADRSTFALFNCMGTPMIDAMLPQVIESGLPFFAPFSGALLARPKNGRNVFNIRASYPDEAEQLVQHLATVGIKRIGIAYQNNSFGKEVYEGARIAMDKHQLKGGAAVTVENNGADAATAAAKLVEANPEAVLVGLAGKPTLDFVKAIRAQRRGLPLYALSVMGSAATLRALGDDAIGIAVSQVVPSPAKSVMPVVRQFQQAWKATGTALEPSHLALEGYINARVFVEALTRAGRNPSRERFIESTWAIKRHDLGGFEVNFSEPGKNASRYVELTMVGRDGKFIR
ncbi:ABC transporter substrate-binding protein [Ramlibacter sp. WS9]|uniref:ABC transporter substrate-binding protein n=1 Tax=Ramlibacter sp. WS9 TaxID=1882741 RepID=UPI0011416FDE|nr:ABC transporter substrate-binding protein [Ramlibacter sp. WS9]ROZ78733.1 ABC transporter substrate-binding protein [Ramlibacter sp. WS9]